MTGSFVGGYFISSKIYETKNSEIYESMHPEKKFKLVVKFIKYNPAEIERSQNELNINKEIDCCYIMPIIDDIQDDTNKYFCALVMKLAVGGDLFALTCDSNGLDERSAAQAIHAGLMALQYLHKKGICHRDVKPDNFFIMNDNKIELDIVLGDLGHAAYITDQKFTDFNVGNNFYKAPEIFAKIPYDETIDIWSLGVTMYTILSCDLPFPENYQEMKNAILKGIYDFDNEEWENISEEAKDLITSMLQVDPKKRISIDDALNHQWFKKYYVEYNRQSNRAEREKDQNSINSTLHEADHYLSENDDFSFSNF